MHERKHHSVDENRDRPLSFKWRVDGAALRELVDLPPVKNERIGRAMESAVAHAILSAREDPTKRTSYSRRRDWYAGMERYNGDGYTFTTVVPAIDALVDAEIFVEPDRRPPGTASTGVQSSFLPAAWLAELKVPKIKRVPGELIRLKDKNGILQNYRDTQRTSDERKLLVKANAVIAKTDIRLDAPGGVVDGEAIRFDAHTVYPDMIEMYRVYNGGWTSGGRYYGGWWQSVRSEDRQHFILDGEQTVEIDYEQLHPRLLYALAGKHLDGDAYTLDGWERKLCKRAFNILINATGYHQALGAILPYVDGCDVTARELIADIKNKHTAIKDYIHSGAGLRLQNMDSEMCRYVLAQMTVRHGIPVLPVHDSFIVPQSAKDMLITVMKEAFERESGLQQIRQ
ncbi:hypothetical protein [Pararhizobium sp.]|uniref:hypothetical protein n=1 Tax=Pararhizobium sp. TaxID=1977563 RepID=UPI003D13706D